MNSIILVGNLVADPEIRTTQTGVKAARFRLAVQRRFQNAQGVREADFIDCICWRGTAEIAEKYLRKGNSAGVRGSLMTRTYDAQDGTKRWTAEVNVEELQLMRNGNRESAPMPEEPYATQADSRGFTEVTDDELPF